MPFVICEFHGGNIASHGCPHVAESIAEKRSPGHITHVDLDGIFFQGWVCDDCLATLNQHGLQAYVQRHQNFSEYPPEKEIESLLDLLDLQPMCVKCFETLVETQRGQLEKLDRDVTLPAGSR